MAKEKSTITYQNIPDFPGYRVGNDGSVWSSRCGIRYGRFDEWKKLTTHMGTLGRPQVVLYKDKEPSTLTVSRLVLVSFVGPCPEGMECCHNDGDCSNDKLSNLRWDTKKANSADRIRHGTNFYGTKCTSAKLTDQAVTHIRKTYDGRFETIKLLSRLYNVSTMTVRRVVNRKTWTHL